MCSSMAQKMKKQTLHWFQIDQLDKTHLSEKVLDFKRNLKMGEKCYDYKKYICLTVSTAKMI